MSLTSEDLVGMFCSPRRLASLRDFSRAFSSSSKCFSVSLRETGIGMARVDSNTRDAILEKKQSGKSMVLGRSWSNNYAELLPTEP